MAKNCGCPIFFNIIIGLFLIALAIVGFIKLFSIQMPIWLSVLNLLLGLLTIILNSINRLESNVDNMSTEQANKMHANEGF